MPRAPSAAALVLAALLAPASPQDAAKKGPPAFVPLESPAATSHLRAAADHAKAGRHAEAAESYQALVDGPLGDRLATHDGDRDTLEQARERAHREISFHPGLPAEGRAALRDAYRKRFEETAGRLLEAALGTGDDRALRVVLSRFPLTDAGARAGTLLARAAYRRGDPEECLGILDRLLDLHAGGPFAANTDVRALQASAAAAAGDADLFDSVEKAAAFPGPGAGTAAGASLRAHLAACRASLDRGGRAAPGGPRGPLVLLWQWMPGEDDRAGPPDEFSMLPVNQSELPPHADHLVAVAGGRVYWTDRYGVTALDLATGKPVARSVAPEQGSAAPGNEHRGETFAPAADASGVVAALDLAGSGPGGRRVGTLNLLDGDLRLLARRGGDGDLEHPEMRRRFVFHGRPLLLGDRVFAAATEAVPPGEQAAGDVRTHVLAFRRADLEPLWDAFVSYGSGIHISDVAPAGSLAHRHGRLYFTTQTGLEACLEARTGAVLWARRYRVPEMAPTPRLAGRPDQTMAPNLWHESPPVFSGDLVAFAPRDSYSVDFLHQRPLRGAEDPETGKVRGAGSVLEDELSRPRLDREAMTTLWVLPGRRGMFFLAGQTAGREAAPLVLRNLDPGATESIPWRGPVMEPTITGLPALAGDAIYAATEKALVRVPWSGRDGEIEVLATIPPADPENPRPSPGNLVVLTDRILSVHDDGVMCFGPAK